jgi:hypothetical protein
LILGSEGESTQGDLTLVNCQIYDNGNDVINNYNNKVRIENSTLESNGVNSQNTIIKNTILTQTYPGQFYCGRWTLFIDHSIIRNIGNVEWTSTANLYEVDPRFANPAAGDFHLLPNSPAIDAGDPGSDFSGEPACPAGNRGIDIGAYGNTPEATCISNHAKMVFEPTAFSRRLLGGEIRFDTLKVRNAGTDPMTVHGLKDIVINDPDLKALETTKGGTTLGKDEFSLVFLRFAASATRKSTIPIQVNFPSENVGEAVNYEINVPDDTYDSLFDNHWDFSYSQVNSKRTLAFQLRNRGANPIRVDSLRESSPYFNLEGVSGPFTIEPGDSQTVPVSFTPPSTQPFQARLRLYSSNIDAIDSTLILSGTGVDAKDPIAVIDSIYPNPVTWGQTFNVFGKAHDQDAIGTEPQIIAYQWLVNGDTVTASNLAGMRSERLAIGWNRIEFRVMDNEGTWSAASLDSILMVGLPPKIESFRCATGLILTSDTAADFRVKAYDQDENAKGKAGGDIARVRWFSTRQGFLGEGADLSIAPAKLQLGSHGFYARVWDNEGDSATSDTLWIPVQTAVGRAVLVAGTAFDDYRYFFENIAPNLNFAYQRLRDRGFSDEQIHYMNPVGWQSVDDPYRNSGIVDDTHLTLQALHDHLKTLKKDAQNHVPITLLFLGHGSASRQNGRFFLSPEESLSPDTLSAWLEEWGDLDAQDNQITVVLDFCYSGAFIPKLRTALQQKRFIITSSDENNLAYFIQGKSFSWSLFDQLDKGRNLADAFQAAKEWSDGQSGVPLAHPQLNANNNLKGNEPEDAALSGSIYIGGSHQFQAPLPEILDISDIPVLVPEPHLDLFAKVRGEPDSLWFSVIPPDFGGLSQDFGNLMRGPFEKTSDSTWKATLSGPFKKSGSYLLLVGGKDASGRGMLAQSHEFNPAASGILPHTPVLSATALFQNSPNPFRNSTTIAFFLAQAAETHLEILDVHGKVLRELAGGFLPRGLVRSGWDGRDGSSRQVGSGVYFYRLRAGRENLLKKMMVLP